MVKRGGKGFGGKPRSVRTPPCEPPEHVSSVLRATELWKAAPSSWQPCSPRPPLQAVGGGIGGLGPRGESIWAGVPAWPLNSTA